MRGGKEARLAPEGGSAGSQCPAACSVLATQSSTSVKSTSSSELGLPEGTGGHSQPGQTVGGGGVAMEPVLEETLTVNGAHSHLEGAAGAFQSS